MIIGRFQSSSSHGNYTPSPNPPTAPPCTNPRPLDCEVWAFCSISPPRGIPGATSELFSVLGNVSPPGTGTRVCDLSTIDMNLSLMREWGSRRTSVKKEIGSALPSSMAILGPNPVNQWFVFLVLRSSRSSHLVNPRNSAPAERLIVDVCSIPFVTLIHSSLFALGSVHEYYKFKRVPRSYRR